MSQSVRSAGVGLIVGAILMSALSVDFFQSIIQSPRFLAFTLALKTISPSVATASDIGMILPAVFAAACIGAGLLVAGIVVPLVENMLWEGLTALTGGIILATEKISRFISEKRKHETD